jgi:hypothetical protein
VEENIPQRSAFERLLPTEDGYACGLVATVTTAPSFIDLNSEWGLSASQLTEEYVTKDRVKRGGAWVTVQPKGGDVTVRRVRADATPASTTGGNVGTGIKIEDGKAEDFWVDSTRPKLDVVGTAAMNAFVYFSSRNINGGKQT